VVFVPRQQLAVALQQAIIRASGPAAGLTVTTLGQYAASLAEVSFLVDGTTKLEPGPQFFLRARLVRDLSPGTQSALTGDQPLTGVVASLNRMFTTLRLHDIDAETYAAQTPSSPRRSALAETYAAYESSLEQGTYYDEAELFTRATHLVTTGSVDTSNVQWALLNSVELCPVERSFVAALRAQSDSPESLHLLDAGSTKLQYPSQTEDRSSSAPPSLAAHQFSDAAKPAANVEESAGVAEVLLSSEASLSEEVATRLRFWTATGIRRELQAVFEDLIERDRPLDTVEIAYTTPEPYLSLLDQMTERYDVPVSLSGGRAVEATRPGQALSGFFEWAADGGSVPGLIELLRAGLVRLDRPISTGDETVGTLDHHRAATILAQRRYSDDPTQQVAPLTAWIDQLDDEIETLRTEAGEASWVDDRIAAQQRTQAAVRTCREVVRDLHSLAHLTDHNSVTLREFADASETFLEQYGPTPAPPEEETERTADEAARNRLIERLRTFQASEHEEVYRPRTLARHMQTWLSLSPFIRAQRPQPGHVHVVPLESAGYTNRNHLYVVGLDATSASPTLPRAPLLSDEEREALSSETGALPRRTDEMDVEAWRMQQALVRHRGTFTFSASTYDLTEDEDLFEAPLFLQLKEAAEDAADQSLTNHYSLTSEKPRVLSPLEQWTSRTPPSPDRVHEILASTFPWLTDGLEAAEARASDTYTVYDGLLASGSYDDLDPLNRSRPVTAGRLETYARSPYAYFLRYVLDVEPVEEPALDDVAWLDALGKGAVLHGTFQRFMAALQRVPTLDDKPLLREHFDACMDDRRTNDPPPSEVVYATTYRDLWNDALLFLRVEAARSDSFAPHQFEVGFGYPPHRQSEEDYPDAPVLQLNDHTFELRGRVDRVDRSPDGRLRIWDYKTGSSRRYDETDLLEGGTHLQWALYAYALEHLLNAEVDSAGYFFTSTDEMGKRISANPASHRHRVAKILEAISDGVASGAFPVTDSDDLRYSFDRLFQRYEDRRKELTAKTWPVDRPTPPALRDE
jgi:hypothetical protein